MTTILLTTINAQYMHASLGLRYLLANLGELRSQAKLVEFTLDDRPIDIVESLLAHNPKIIGLGVYIWNITQSTEVVALLKAVRPDVRVVIGGPEVSYECDEQRIVQLANYVITGQADLAFAQLCNSLLIGERPADKIIRPAVPKMDDVVMPYREYTNTDIAKRLIYVEASRGCPFKCEFCLSSLDKTAWPFQLERFLGELHTLYERGVRHFKFVDRTFNLNIKASKRILDFFLERMTAGQRDNLFVHFELIPDHLPDALRESITKFPPGSLQFEIGIQSLNPKVQKHISRKQDDVQTAANLRWLREHTNAHLHADLIIGLPDETMASFGSGFDKLVKLNPHEIQVGILKRLRGTPIARHTEAFDMRYNPQPPYNILSNGNIDFATMQRLNRFAKYWDMIGNSGRFVCTRPLLLGDAPFERFLAFSDWLFETTGQTHRIALDRLYTLVFDGITTLFAIDADLVRKQLSRDYFESGARGAPKFLAKFPALVPVPTTVSSAHTTTQRQARHRREAIAKS
ncbi:MAG: DUF4080 domain-containing protein [Candidatus Obscuribacterales bacterium]|nr:DUF4080 domain-containing protein [Steroidobacteraceae bacterium]